MQERGDVVRGRQTLVPSPQSAGHTGQGSLTKACVVWRGRRQPNFVWEGSMYDYSGRTAGSGDETDPLRGASNWLVFTVRSHGGIAMSNMALT